MAQYKNVRFYAQEMTALFYNYDKMKRQEILLLVITSAIISACAVIEETEGIYSVKNDTFADTKTITTKSVIQEDSLQVALQCQTNKRLILIHQIKQLDGVFYLNLTEQDIAQLSIPDSLYVWAQNCVLALNQE
jgi:hypothetical protein